MQCSGNSADHCCYISGLQCIYLEENTVTGRRWACGLLRREGSWQDVYKTLEYVSIRNELTASGIAQDCGDWPPPGVRCGTCGGVD